MSILPGVPLNRRPQSSVPALKAISPLRTRCRAPRESRPRGRRFQAIRLHFCAEERARANIHIAGVALRQRASAGSALKLCVAATIRREPARVPMQTSTNERKTILGAPAVAAEAPHADPTAAPIPVATLLDPAQPIGTREGGAIDYECDVVSRNAPQPRITSQRFRPAARASHHALALRAARHDTVPATEDRRI